MLNKYGKPLSLRRSSSSRRPPALAFLYRVVVFCNKKFLIVLTYQKLVKLWTHDKLKFDK